MEHQGSKLNLVCLFTQAVGPDLKIYFVDRNPFFVRFWRRINNFWKERFSFCSVQQVRVQALHIQISA